MNESMNEYYLMNTKLLRKAGWSYALHTHVSYVRTYYVRTYCLYVWQRGTLGRTTSKPWLLKSAELVFASITEYSTFIIYRLTWLLPFLEIWFDRRPSRILIVVASSSRSWYRSLLLVRPPHYSTTGVSARCVDDVVAVVAVVVGDKQESLGQYSRSSIVNRQSSYSLDLLFVAPFAVAVVYYIQKNGPLQCRTGSSGKDFQVSWIPPSSAL